jgi:hypothetical protein
VRIALLVVIALVFALPADAKAPPAKDVARLKRQVSSLRAEAARLRAENTVLRAANALSLLRERALARHVAAVDPCPITRPNGSVPPGSTFGSEFHGNGALWVGLWPANVVVDEPKADGAIDAKVGWWRGVPGTLSITGRRLDAAAPPLRATVSDGYGESGFQASGLSFPTEGCWEVTGRVGTASLTFVTLVLAAS